MAPSTHLYEPATADNLVQTVMTRSGQNLTVCFQCRRCAAGCPVAEETGYITPDRLIRMIIIGDRQGALNNPLVWRCVSCLTCGERCPNDIKTAKINDVLKQMALEEGIKPLNPRVAYFHHAFTNAAVRWGRVNEPELMSFYEIKNILNHIAEGQPRAIPEEIRRQARLGLAMGRMKRLHVGLESSRGRREIKRLVKKYRRSPQRNADPKEKPCK